MVKEDLKVLTAKEIKQKMAGYKSSYTKKIRAAKTEKEKKFLEKNREAWLGEIENRIVSENKKMIQRRAGYLSWETRRAKSMSEKSCECKKTSKKSCKKAHSYSSVKGVSVIKKH